MDYGTTEVVPSRKSQQPTVGSCDASVAGLQLS